MRGGRVGAAGAAGEQPRPDMPSLGVLGAPVVEQGPERLAAEGYGEYAPFADNATAQGRAENRKVVIAISKFAARPLNNQQQIPAEATPEQVEQILQQV